VTEKISGPEESPGFLLWRTTLQWQRVVTKALKPLGITHVQFVLLATTWWLTHHADGPSQLPSQRQIATQANTDIMMTSTVVRTLESRGLLTRTADPHDARTKRIAVTSAGTALVEQAIEVVEITDTAFFHKVIDQDSLLRILQQLAHPMSDQNQ
jgi:DNA-binding MarR family transcriptional regulator